MSRGGESEDSHAYLQIGRHVVCLDWSVAGAFRQLLLRYANNDLASLGISRRLARVFLTAVLRGSIGMLPRNGQISMPVRSQVGMRVHRGWKLFDFSHDIVTKVFSAETSDADRHREIDASRTASGIPAAPRFRGAADSAWYSEELIRGVHATSGDYRDARRISELYPDAEACLLALVGSGDTVIVDAHAHFDRLADEAFEARWLESGRTADDISEVRAFLTDTRDWLEAHLVSDKLSLVRAHGDFSLVNAIATGNGLRFIDWEGIAPGGVYSDIFNFAFVERYYGRLQETFHEVLGHLLNAYRDAGLREYPALREAFDADPTFARRQYYLERMRVLLDREPSDNLCSVVRKSIAMFREFESLAAGSG